MSRQRIGGPAGGSSGSSSAMGNGGGSGGGFQPGMIIPNGSAMQHQQQQAYAGFAPDYPPGHAPPRPSSSSSGPVSQQRRQREFSENSAASGAGHRDYDNAVQQGYDPQRRRPSTKSREEERGSPAGPSARTPPQRERRRQDPLQTDEEELLKLYGLSTLQPDVWEDTNEDATAIGDGLTPGPDKDPSSPLARPSSAHSRRRQPDQPDEPDPLGLYRGSIMSNVPELPAEKRANLLLQSKTFSPSEFLSIVHPSANPNDLAFGRDRLKEAIESRSGALHRLVEENFDKFIGIKAATSNVYEEMKLQPLSREGDYSVGDLKESLQSAQSKADGVWSPILEARLKADRLRSTLGVFERSKFFFTLPGLLSESIAQGRYDSALIAYKKGKYLLDSRPGALLGLPPGATMNESQREKHRRVFEKVWGQVERTMMDLKVSLAKKLQDPRRGIEEVEKVIEILGELDEGIAGQSSGQTGGGQGSQSDPYWIYFDTQHTSIMQALRMAFQRSTGKFHAVMKKIPANTLEETPRAIDLRNSVLALDLHGNVSGSSESYNGSSSASLSISDVSAGHEAFRAMLDVVHVLSDILLQTLPNFWKITKVYTEGKYGGKGDGKKGSKNANANIQNTAGRRNPAHVKEMLLEIVNLYIALLSEFFVLSASFTSPKPDSDDVSAPLPAFIPPSSNALTTSNWLLKILVEILDCTNEIGGGGLPGIDKEVQSVLKDFLSSVRWRFTEAICASWVRDAKIFYRLESWILDSDQVSCTVYLKRISSYQRSIARLAYRAAGGNEERSTNLFTLNPGAAVALLRTRARDEPIPGEFVRRIQTAYLDALYAFLDGLVHVAFSEPMFLSGQREEELEKARSPTSPATVIVKAGPGKGAPGEGDDRLNQLDIYDRDVRILLTVSNLSHFRNDHIVKLVEQLSVAFKLDMSADSRTLTDVVNQLDKILFDDYIKGRSASLGATIERGVLGDGIDWAVAPKPSEVHYYIYDVLLSLVLVHAQVTAIARSLVTRTVNSLVEEVATHALRCFKQVPSFGMGGMLQATLEMEFLHQTLNVHVSERADSILQEIYKIISMKSDLPRGADMELQKELEQLKLTLTQARRATALQFLCFREKKNQQTSAAAAASGAAAAANTAPPPPQVGRR